MKELKKRCRGLFVLLLAVTFFLQGGWLMPSDAATSDEYLIVLQNSNTKSQIIGGENRPADGYTAYDAIPLGVYKSTNGKISELIYGDTVGITDDNVRTLNEAFPGSIDSLTNISDISEAKGATVYVLGNSQSGMKLSLTLEGPGQVQWTGKKTQIKHMNTELEDHYFSKIEYVTGVKSAVLDAGFYGDMTLSEPVYDGTKWNTIKKSDFHPVSIMNNTASYRLAASTKFEVGYELVFKTCEPSIDYTVSDVNVGYDGKPHGITVNVTKPTSDYKITYGTSEGDITKTESPTFTEAGEYTVYYKIEATGFDTVVGSAKVVIKNDAPIQYTVTYVLDGGKLDGQTGTVTKKVDAGTVITLPAPTKDGFTFDYWEGSKYNAGDKYTVNEDHTFKAVWKAADEDGSESSSGKKGVKTGDENNLGFWIFLMSAALIGFAGMAFSTIKRR